MDVVVVVDGSFSIGADVFNGILKNTLLGLVDNLFGLGRDMKIGIVLYSSNVDANIGLSTNAANLKQSIRNLQYPFGATWTNLGIQAAKNMLSSGAARTGSTKVSNIVKTFNVMQMNE